MKHVVIDPVTRLEGHGKIDIFLNDHGDVENCYFQVPELRGFERFCVGRPAEELPRIVTRLCGVCPAAHHMASAKAVDEVFNAEPPSAARKLRELFYSVYFVYDHTLHFYYLGAPDFVLGPDAAPEKRNIVGVIEKVGLEVGSKVIEHRRYAQDMQILITGGRSTHPVWALPGGVSKGLSEQERRELKDKGQRCLEFAKFSLKLFEDVVLSNETYRDLIFSDAYRLEVGDMGLLDENNRVNFYDGAVRVTDPEGNEVCRYAPTEYLDHVAEMVLPHSYLKYPFLKKLGWQGFKEGPGTSVYRAIPLSRLNVADGMATPLAQEHFEKMYDAVGGKPCHATLVMHWARLIEMLYAAEHWLELVDDPEITSEEVRTMPSGVPREGVGIVEAPRGTLTHHYKTDADGITTEVNLIVGTTNNNAPITMSIKKAAQSLIRNIRGEVDQALLNMVEMAFRAYDPCFACATHSLPGQMPLKINIFDARGDLIKAVSRL